MLQLMKIESERLIRWITEYLNSNLVNCLEDSYAHKYTTNTHVIHCGLAQIDLSIQILTVIAGDCKKCIG